MARRVAQDQVAIDGDLAFVTLTRGYVAIISATDAELVSKRLWCAYASGSRIYAQTATGSGNKKISLHRYILGDPDGDVDHKNRNTLDNRRENLRICSRSENNANRPKRKSSGSYRGVYRTGSGKWMARISDGTGAMDYIGSFFSEEEAATAYNSAAVARFGEFAELNTVEK